MKKYSFLFCGVLLASGFLVASPASASPVTVGNFGFEDPVLADGAQNFSPADWVRVGSASAINLLDATQGVAAEGSNVARANPGGSFSQVLVGEVLTVGTTYELIVGVGSRIDVANGAVYNIQLVVNGDVLAQTGNQTLGVNSLFDDSDPISFEVEAAQIGQDLQIVLLNPAVVDGGTGQALFDNVRLESTTTVIPEPSSLALLSLGIFGIVGNSRRRKS